MVTKSSEPNNSKSIFFPHFWFCLYEEIYKGREIKPHLLVSCFPALRRIELEGMKLLPEYSGYVNHWTSVPLQSAECIFGITFFFSF
jgi:hypothetical protein